MSGAPTSRRAGVAPCAGRAEPITDAGTAPAAAAGDCPRCPPDLDLIAVCRDCGPGVSVDEDDCCAACGADVVVVDGLGSVEKLLDWIGLIDPPGPAIEWCPRCGELAPDAPCGVCADDDVIPF